MNRKEKNTPFTWFIFSFWAFPVSTFKRARNLTRILSESGSHGRSKGSKRFLHTFRVRWLWEETLCKWGISIMQHLRGFLYSCSYWISAEIFRLIRRINFTNRRLIAKCDTRAQVRPGKWGHLKAIFGLLNWCDCRDARLLQMFPVDDARSRGAPVLCSLDISTLACVLRKLTTFAAVSPPPSK